MATNGKGTGIVGYNGKKGRSAWRIRSASGRRGRGVEFAPDSLLEEGGFELSVPGGSRAAPAGDPPWLARRLSGCAHSAPAAILSAGHPEVVATFKTHPSMS